MDEEVAKNNKINTKWFFKMNKQFPIFLNFPVTNKCNSKCIMCNIWKQKELSKELTLKDIKIIFSNKLFSKLKIIGITGGEPTLRDDLNQVIQIILNNALNINLIGLTTNGLDTNKVITQIKKISKICVDKQVKLKISVSLDGVGDTHNKVRGIPNAFEKTSKTLNELKELKKRKLITDYSIGCTISKINVSKVREIDEWAKENNIHIIFRLATAINRIHNQKTSKNYEITKSKEKEELSSFFAEKYKDKQNKLAERLHYKYLHKLLRGNQILRKPCIAVEEGLLLDSFGDMYICSVHSDKIGNALENDSYDIYNSKKNIEYRAWLKKNKCLTCKHDYCSKPTIIDWIRLQF